MRLAEPLLSEEEEEEGGDQWAEEKEEVRKSKEDGRKGKEGEHLFDEVFAERFNQASLISFAMLATRKLEAEYEVGTAPPRTLQWFRKPCT
ncbi:hypothetical protein HDU96_009111 [Phlyctochytrium bullatum]|nr:hypothetical protein HDU96_009111 [Phlyctochytrium bullatum]